MRWKGQFRTGQEQPGCGVVPAAIPHLRDPLLHPRCLRVAVRWLHVCLGAIISSVTPDLRDPLLHPRCLRVAVRWLHVCLGAIISSVTPDLRDPLLHPRCLRVAVRGLHVCLGAILLSALTVTWHFLPRLGARQTWCASCALTSRFARGPPPGTRGDTLVDATCVQKENGPRYRHDAEQGSGIKDCQEHHHSLCL